jgi:hypothetical protein
MYRRNIAAGAILAVTLTSAAALATAGATSYAAAPAKAGAFTVTATVNNPEPLVDSKIKIKGTVKPAAPGAKVTLQVHYADGKKWRTLDSTTLSSNSKYKFKDKVSRVTERTYRVVKQAGPHRAAGHSPRLKVTVYGWRDLTSLKAATSNGFTTDDHGVKINGTAYPNSLRAYPAYSPTPPTPPSTIEYNLNRGCKQFRGVVGLDDSSAVAGTAQITLSTDGTAKYHGSFALTQGTPITLDMTNVFRLTVSATLANGGVAAIGTPQVLCNF